MTDSQQLKIDEVGDVTVIRFRDVETGDLASVEQLAQELRRVAAAGDQKRVVLDFSSVESLSSIVLRRLVTFQKQLRAKNGMLKLCNVGPKIYEVFTITKLDGVFDINTGQRPIKLAL